MQLGHNYYLMCSYYNIVIITKLSLYIKLTESEGAARGHVYDVLSKPNAVRVLFFKEITLQENV